MQEQEPAGIGLLAQSPRTRCEQYGAQLQSTRRIHFKQPRRRPANRRDSDDCGAFQLKMVVPSVLPWMVESSHCSVVWINAGHVRSLEKIAAVASQRQIRQGVVNAVLARHDVLHMEANVHRALRQQAILAAVFRSAMNGSTCRRVHRYSRRTRAARAFALMMPTRSMASTMSRYSSLSPSDNRPLFALSANWSIRSCSRGSGRDLRIRSATSGVKHSAIGSRNRSSTAGNVALIF